MRSLGSHRRTALILCDMAQISEITISDIEKSERFDAQYFRPIYLSLESKLQSSTALETYLSYITDGTHQTPQYVQTGTPFLSSGNIEEGFIDFENTKYITPDEHKMLSHCQPTAGDILVSKSGRIGHAAVVPDEYSKGDFNIYEGVALLRTRTINPGALALIINSNPVQLQIQRLQKGVAQPHLHLEDFKSLLIPDFSASFQRRLEKAFHTSTELRLQSKTLYSQAEQLLLSELGLEDFAPEWVAGYETNRDNILDAARMDAEYFQSRHRIIENKIESIAFPLSELCSIKRGSMISMDFYNESGGTPYLRGADFSSGEVNENKLVFIDDCFKKTNETTVKANDIVFASIGSVGTSALITQNFNGSFISNNIGRLRVKNEKILPEYLQVVLQSLVGHMQFERQQTQTAQPKISNDQIGAIKIPVLRMNKQQQISKLIVESFTCRNKSRQLLEQAKKDVEDMIEHRT